MRERTGAEEDSPGVSKFAGVGLVAGEKRGGGTGRHVAAHVSLVFKPDASVKGPKGKKKPKGQEEA